jgi:hypothetical protein
MTRLLQWGVRLLALSIGAILVLAVTETVVGDAMRWTYDKVGVTLIALAPLALWSLFVCCGGIRGRRSMTLAYIGTTAQRIGLLGTVIGIVAATVRIGTSLGAGATDAVAGALPAVGQALVSTAVGFVVAIMCDFFRYLDERRPTREA